MLFIIMVCLTKGLAQQQLLTIHDVEEFRFGPQTFSLPGKEFHSEQAIDFFSECGILIFHHTAAESLFISFLL
jgi:hypothetical protein